MSQTKSYDWKYIVKLLIGLFFLFVGGYVFPTWADVTPVGVAAVSIFIGVVFLMSTGFGMLFPSLLGMFAMQMTGYYTSSTIVSGSFGDVTIYQLIVIYGKISCHVIGEGKAIGLCGSGLLDLVAVLLETGIIDESGYLEGGVYRIEGTDVSLTQKDVREVQLAKAAIYAGIQLMAQHLGVKVDQIQKVLLAGAFGNYMDPASACRIGMIPECLRHRIQPIGNAAGEGAKLCALSTAEFEYSKGLAENTEFLELASCPEFQDWYVDALEFGEAADDDL